MIVQEYQNSIADVAKLWAQGASGPANSAWQSLIPEIQALLMRPGQSPEQLQSLMETLQNTLKAQERGDNIGVADQLKILSHQIQTFFGV